MIRIICGPTAAGKSGIALELAARHGLTIVSADSRQVYRGFDIGTAKPTQEEQSRVPHVGIDVADPTERWSAARWAEDATREIAGRGEANVVVVGGTGLYLRALTAPLFNEPALDPGRRAQLALVTGHWPLERLRAWVQELDPRLAQLGRTQLLRAIEVAVLTGKRLSDLHRSEQQAPRFTARWLVVDPGDQLGGRIERRIDQMLEAGWVDEAKRLAQSVPESAPAWQGCGYVTVRNIANGAESVAKGRAAILVSTRQYAKRQRTWFRHQLSAGEVTRLDPAARDAERQVRDWWASEEEA